jgi:hypothetical protein
VTRSPWRRGRSKVAVERLGSSCYALVALLGTLAPSVAAHGVSPGWTQLGPPGASLGAIAVDPLGPESVYAGLVFDGRLFMSSDGASSWRELPRLPTDYGIELLAAAPSRSGTLYALSLFDLFATTDGGQSWREINPAADPTITDLAVHPDDAQTAYVATADGLFKTADGGASWLFDQRRLLLACRADG